jgi:glycopeptide antibiotics resistance protein
MINLLLALGYMAGIYWLSSIPGETDPENALLSGIILWTPPAIQNLVHIPLFGVLAWLWYRLLSARIKNDRLLFSATFLLATGFGILDELHQLTVPGRYASLTDIALNTLGAGFAVWLIYRQGLTTRHPPD